TFLQRHLCVPMWFMEHHDLSPEPTPNVPARTQRHDGWTPDRMATFLEVLADTGMVSEGYRAAGMSHQAAYNLRTRDPVFAAAWHAAQSHARPQVADGLLERSITGTVEHYYRDGVLVGERRHYESWLGLAVLKRSTSRPRRIALTHHWRREWQVTGWRRWRRCAMAAPARSRTRSIPK